MKVKKLFEEILEEDKEKDFYKRGYRFVVGVKDSQGTLKHYFENRKEAEEYLERVKNRKTGHAMQVSAIYELKENLSEMAAGEKQKAEVEQIKKQIKQYERDVVEAQNKLKTAKGNEADKLKNDIFRYNREMSKLHEKLYGFFNMQNEELEDEFKKIQRKKFINDILEKRRQRKVETNHKATIKCNECGHKFQRHISSSTYEIKCPKCTGYDTEVIQESILSEMAADEKQRRIKQLQDQLTQVTDELRNADPKDLSRKQQITNRRFEIQKQLNTLRQIEVTK